MRVKVDVRRQDTLALYKESPMATSTPGKKVNPSIYFLFDIDPESENPIENKLNLYL